MMNNNYYPMEGTLRSASAVETIQTKKGPAKKRYFTIETNEEYPNIVKFEIFGDQRIEEFRALAKGDYIRVYFSVKGREYTSKKTGETDVFNTNAAIKFEKVDLSEEEEEASVITPDTVDVSGDDEDLPF